MAIVPVAKVTLYGSASQKVTVLEGLQALGCMHLLDLSQTRTRTQANSTCSQPRLKH